jgi:superfamily I DNA and RNA helicase
MRMHSKLCLNSHVSLYLHPQCRLHLKCFVRAVRRCYVVTELYRTMEQISVIRFIIRERITEEKKLIKYIEVIISYISSLKRLTIPRVTVTLQSEILTATENPAEHMTIPLCLPTQRKSQAHGDI